MLVVTDEDFKKFDEMRTEMYKGVSSAPAGEDLTLHLGLDITGSETDKIDFGTPVMEVVKDLKKNGGLSENSWITSESASRNMSPIMRIMVLFCLSESFSVLFSLWEQL